MMTTVVMECKVCGCWVDVLVVPAVQWSCLSVCLFVCRSVGRDEIDAQAAAVDAVQRHHVRA